MASLAAQQATPILEEYKRLQDIQAGLTDLWRDEVHLYEQTIAVGGVGEAENYYCETRNHFNRQGTVEDERLFPYHTALYPLLDCYDSIEVKCCKIGWA